MIESDIVLLLQLSGIVLLSCQYAVIAVWQCEDQNADNTAECGDKIH